jgi:RNA polymerase sigma-70 factor, ECF subfamily
VRAKPAPSQAMADAAPGEALLSQSDGHVYHRSMGSEDDQLAGDGTPLACRLAVLAKSGRDLSSNSEWEAGWKKLTARFGAFLAAIARRRHIRPDDIEDLVQIIFLAAAAGVGNYRGDAPFKSWLAGICSRKIADRINEYAQERNTEGAAVDETGRDPHPSPESMCAAWELRAILRRAAARLPEKQKQILLLTLEGSSFAEIGELRGCSADSVRARYFEAKEALLDILRRMRVDPRAILEDLP